MKITLIDPQGFSDGLNTGLGYLSAVLDRTGYNVSVIDMNNKAGNTQKRISGIRNSDMIGISIKSYTLENSLSLLKTIKATKTKATLIAGGPHVSLDSQNFLRNNKFDIAVVGEGEKTFLELVKKSSLGRIRGIAFRKGDEIIVNEKREWIKDLNKLPFPKYDNFDSVQDKGRIEYYPLVTSRGCPYNCSYCSVGNLIGKRWRARKPRNIINELLNARKKYKSMEFKVLDDNFTMDIKRAKELCQMLINEKLNFSWSCPNGIRADRLDMELLQLMKDSGCHTIALGIESGCKPVFNKIAKGEKLEHIKSAVSMANRAGIKVDGFFIIGLPSSTYIRDKQSIAFAKKLGLDSASFGLLVPYPGTPVWKWTKKNRDVKILRNWKGGFHIGFLPKPVFETGKYRQGERLKMYYLANLRFLKPKKLLFIIKSLFKRIKKG